MRNIQGISFVRSGHHLLITCLLKYFAKDATFRDPFFWQTGTYAEWAQRDKSNFEEEQQNRHPRPIRVGAFQYCEYYSHCLSTPCSSVETTFQKNHDFDLKLPISSDTYYLVQFRHPIPSIISNFCAMHGKHIKNLHRLDWEKQAKKWIEYWRKWMKKWIIKPKPSPHRLLLPYEELLSSPMHNLCKAVSFTTGEPEQTVNKELLSEIIAHEKISQKNILGKFCYYDSTFLEKLQEKASKEIIAAGIKMLSFS